MNEQKQETEEKKSAGAEQDTEAGVQPKELDKVERAELAIKRFEEFEKRIDEKISKLTELKADRLLGSSAGEHIEAKPAKEESASDYYKKVMSGGLNKKPENVTEE